MTGTGNRTYALWLLVLAHIVAYADRQVMAVLLPAVRKSFDISLVEASLLHGFAFSFFFIFAGIPIGRLVDRKNRKNLLAIGIGLWSLATIWCGLTSSYGELLAARLAVGVGEAVLTPATASLMADMFSPKTRGRAVTGVQVGSPLGTLLGLTGAGWLLTHLDTTGLAAQYGLSFESWQIVFIVLGAPGLIIAILFAYVREPERRELEKPSVGAAGAPDTGVWAMFRNHTAAMVLLFSLFTCAFAIPVAILAWAPSLFMMAYGMTAAEAGGIVGLMLVFGAISAYVASGWSSDVMRQMKPDTGRVLLSWIMMPVVLVTTALFYFSSNLSVVAIAIGATLFASASVGSGGILAVQAIVPNRSRATLVAVYLLVTNMTGLGIAPTVIAFIAEQWGDTGQSLQQAMAVFCFALALLALIILPFVVRTYSGMRKYETEEYGEMARH